MDTPQHFILKLNAALLVSLIVAGPAWAITVDCDGGIADHATIGAALGAAVDGDTISITGGCAELDTVRINGFDGLTLEGNGATATISQPVVACDSTDPAPPVLRINNSTNIFLRRLVIRGGRGVRIDRSTVNTDEDITIEESRGNGLGVSGASVVNIGNSASDTANLIRNNCGAGASAGFGSVLTIRGATTIQSNRNGVSAGNGSQVSLSPGRDENGNNNETLIRDNEVRGVNAFSLSRVSISGRVIIEDNSDVASDDPAFPFRAGVRVRFGAVGVCT